MHSFGNLTDFNELKSNVNFNLKVHKTNTNLTAIDLKFYLRTSQ